MSRSLTIAETMEQLEALHPETCDGDFAVERRGRTVTASCTSCTLNVEYNA